MIMGLQTTAVDIVGAPKASILMVLMLLFQSMGCFLRCCSSTVERDLLCSQVINVAFNWTVL